MAFLTMEYVDGQALSSQIPSQGLPLDRLLPIAIPIADAVGSAHQAGIIHRDLKPGNVMVTSANGRVKVLDFGLAKLHESHLVDAGASTGTVPITGRRPHRRHHHRVHASGLYLLGRFTRWIHHRIRPVRLGCRRPGAPLSTRSGEQKVVRLKTFKNLMDVVWSSDGRSLFATTGTVHGGALLHVMLDGTAQIVRLFDSRAVANPRPSPDGRSVLVGVTSTNSNAWVIER